MLILAPSIESVIFVFSVDLFAFDTLIVPDNGKSVKQLREIVFPSQSRAIDLHRSPSTISIENVNYYFLR